MTVLSLIKVNDQRNSLQYIQCTQKVKSNVNAHWSLPSLSRYGTIGKLWLQRSLPCASYFAYFLTQGRTLTYFEICPARQVRLIFTCPNWKSTCPHIFVWYSLAGFSVPTTALHKRGFKFYLSCRTSGVGSSIVQWVLSVVPGSRTISE